MSQVFGGVASGLHFNLAVAAVGSVVAAGLAGFRRAPRSRAWISAAVIIAAWLFGDGLRILASGGGMFRVAAGGVVSLAIGYALPALAGAYVGRQVHKGTGYLSAGLVALMVVAALAAVVQPVAAAISRLG
jgi:hypothetical protein